MQLKKALLGVSALLSAAIWAPQAQAIPAFARQVGMPCSACHYQHFPTLNSFGRAFKEGGFTMVGAEQKIEGDGLSIPATLNLAFVTNLQYTKTNGTPGNTNQVTKDYNNGLFEMTQYSLFMGGRVGHGIGFEGEVGLNGGAALASVKMPFSQDWGSFKTLEVPFTTDGLGPQQGFELLSDGASPVHLFNQQDLMAISASEYLATDTGAHGLALVAANDNGYINFTKWGLDSMIGNGGESANPGANGGIAGAGSPTANYLRGVWFVPVGDFDGAIGFQSWSGSSASVWSDAAGGPAVLQTKATGIDGQLMGDVGGMPLTFIASYATAPASDASGTNQYNPSTDGARKSFNMGAELGVLPKTTVQLGYRNAKSGIAEGGSSNASDNALMLGATYSIALNVRAEFTYSKYSGDAYNSTAAAMQPGGSGDQMTEVNLWMGF